MKIPKPGAPVRGSKSGQPIMALFDLLGRSWAMGVIWNLNHGPCTFRELQVRCNTVSPTTLNSRLKELTNAYIIERCMEGYQLTQSGKELYTLLSPLGEWSRKWAKKF
ncbi:helix-turn-helix transcriptional regulator [Fulvivirga ulvae]|uniref:winged helix-turn-helix transcriptional regulator n=1 Tax=Fulvivirga ulvae TaxID=2904245 RepID=UPI001F26E48D|nr:helix-turn-helix domain-containing protein [Fulvivirga ulvae]UII32346.1 helix-turn-helix transcriptional regulator [Fulvivirga ulvae]